MLNVLITQDSDVEDLFCSALSQACLFSLGPIPVQDDFQHSSARKTDEAGDSVVLAEL